LQHFHAPRAERGAQWAVGLSSRFFGASRHLSAENRIHFFPAAGAAIRLEIPKRAFQITMSHPLLNSAKINAVPQCPRRECRTKLMQPEVVRIQLGARRNSLAFVEEIQLGLAA